MGGDSEVIWCRLLAIFIFTLRFKCIIACISTLVFIRCNFLLFIVFLTSRPFPTNRNRKVKTEPVTGCNEEHKPPEMEPRTSSKWSLCFLSPWQYFSIKQYHIPWMMKSLCWGFTDYKYIPYLYLVAVSGEDVLTKIKQLNLIQRIIRKRNLYRLSS